MTDATSFDNAFNNSVTLSASSSGSNSDFASVTSELECQQIQEDLVPESGQSTTMDMAPTAIPLARSERQSRFFLSDEFLRLRVGATHFKIPTFILKIHSPKLRNLLDSKGTVDMGLEAFLQGDFNDTDFERFLAVLFPSVYGQYDASSVEEWASVLKVAHEWEFESIRKLALAQIEPIATAVDEVVFGKGYDVPAWTEKGRIRLCRREEPITPEEGVRLGLEEVLKISDIRQRIRPDNLFAVVDSSVIRALFSGDLHDVKNIVHKSEVAIKSRLTQLKEELDRFTKDQENKRIVAQKETRRVIAEEEAKRTRVKSETKSLSLNAQVERDGIKAETERIQSAHRIAWVGIQHQQESLKRETEKIVEEEKQKQLAAQQESKRILQRESDNRARAIRDTQKLITEKDEEMKVAKERRDRQIQEGEKRKEKLKNQLEQLEITIASLTKKAKKAKENERDYRARLKDIAPSSAVANGDLERRASAAAHGSKDCGCSLCVVVTAKEEHKASSWKLELAALAAQSRSTSYPRP